MGQASQTSRDRRQLGKWVRCPQCGLEYREKSGKRRAGPRAYLWCPRCGKRSPFTGYLDGSGAVSAPKAERKARAYGVRDQQGGRDVTRAKADPPPPETTPHEPDAAPVLPAAPADGVLPAVLADVDETDTTDAADGAEPAQDPATEVEEKRRYIPRTTFERLAEGVFRHRDAG